MRINRSFSRRFDVSEQLSLHCVARQMLIPLTFAVLLAPHARAQEAAKPEAQAEQQHHHATAAITLELPRFGRSQTNTSEPLFTLERALQTARGNNPTYRQDEAGKKAARARAQQAALYPNPSVGYSGDEIRGGEIHGGKQGFFVEQTIVTGGKLSRAREVMNKDLKLAEIESEEQQMRVETAVRMAFYRVLAAQEMVDSRADLARIAEQIVETERRLPDAWQVDASPVVAAQLDAYRARH